MSCDENHVLAEEQVTFIGRDPKIIDLLALTDRVARVDATVLICGETGTGKELIARRLWRQSRREQATFQVVNCAAVPAELQESIFFGHERGAFTGAGQNRVGWFAAADGGTLFLDEVHLMRPALQSMLLRILQTGEYSPVGSTATKHCDVRVVAATNANLAALVSSGDFREDLFYRLNIVPLQVPPLRERRGDIAMLADHFLQDYSQRYGCQQSSLDPAVLTCLQQHRFPGNVRELENLLQRSLILAGTEPIGVHHLPAAVQRPRRLDQDRSPPAGADATESGSFQAAKARVVAEFERRYLEEMLERCGGIVARAAVEAELSERNFHQKLKQYGIDYRRYRTARRVAN